MTLLLIGIFILGYVLITVEHSIHINKTATALITGILCWATYALLGTDAENIGHQLDHHLTDSAEILFFLLGAMTVVELIDAHEGFTLITDRIASRNMRTLLWLISFLTFFLSAMLDNLTSSIVMVTVVRKLIRDAEDRRIMAGMIIIAANAGGAWSPIGDISTTMLWIGGQISATHIMSTMLMPSIVSLAVPLLILTAVYKPQPLPNIPEQHLGPSRPYVTPITRRDRRIMLAIGLSGMLFVPIFKTLTHLPPYMGMMLVLGLIWVASEVIHSDKDDTERKKYTAAYALSRVDTPSVLFFLGILLAVGSLEATGILRTLAESLTSAIGNQDLIVFLIGVVSAIVDNVPIVAASIGMYDLQRFPMDSKLWTFMAYCAGTGGSLLLIGSAAGVAVMGMEKMAFGWYLRKISWLAFVGYVAGGLVYLVEYSLTN